MKKINPCRSNEKKSTGGYGFCCHDNDDGRYSTWAFRDESGNCCQREIELSTKFCLVELSAAAFARTNEKETIMYNLDVHLGPETYLCRCVSRALCLPHYQSDFLRCS